MFGIDEARRRKQLAEEDAWAYANRLTSEQKAKPLPRVLKQSEGTKRFIEKGRAIGRASINNVFTFRTNAPKKLKTKAVKGIYNSPFRR